MNIQDKISEPARQKPLRLWPGVIIVVIQWLLRFVIPAVAPGDTVLQIGVFIGILGGLAVVLWWAFFSRAPWPDRLGAILLIIIALAATSFLLDQSIATANMGLMFIIYSIPVMSLAFVGWAVASRPLSIVQQRASMILTILAAAGFWIFLRTDGMDAALHHDLKWRWAETAEERLLTRNGEEPVAIQPASASTDSVAWWPGFRGPARDGIIHGVRINKDWSASPPLEMWRRPVGPGCSSFSVNGNLFYTQEQLGEYEIVSCYNLNSGRPVWKHRDKARFYDSHAGAGPRSTPTLSGGRVYTLGGTGILNVLDAIDGSVIWSRDAATENSVKVLNWGFTGSPLVVNDAVIISLSGKLVSYDTTSGKPLWSGPDGGSSYSSPHLVSIAGVPQILLMSMQGAISVDPAGGRQLWKYDWPIQDRILQPALIEGGDLMFAGESKGVCRVSVSHQEGEWSVKEIWKSDEMRLNFNDFMIHKGYAYGFDGASITCIGIEDGRARWKGARYRGWLLLLADQDLFLVLSEKGELALFEATPASFRELGRIQAIKGKTWNHPVLAGNIILVRNSLEMAAYRLPAE